MENVKLKMDYGVAEIILDNPERMNVLSWAVLNEFNEKVDELMNSNNVKVILLKSNSSKAFTAGADISEMQHHTKEEARKFSELGHLIARKLERDLPPVVVALKGYVLGGGVELACACDIRIASDDCIFSQPEINIGVIPGWGGTQRLSRIIGYAKAKELIYTGMSIDAFQALEIGLVNKVVSREEVDEVAESLARELATKSKAALAAAKRAIRMGAELDYEDALRYETEEWTSLFGTHDQREGMIAFLEKRKPRFEE